MDKTNKAKYFMGICYPENMVEDWETVIGDMVQVSYAYCVHNKDTEKDGATRKEHVHIILAFNNTTTPKNAINTLQRLSAEGKNCCSTIESIINIRHAYEYLIHNTETAKKQKKYLYDKSERIVGNNFDIGSFEQISAVEKRSMVKELCNVISQEGFTNFIDFYDYVVMNYDDNYFECIQTYSGLFERLTKGNFQRLQVKYFKES